MASMDLCDVPSREPTAGAELTDELQPPNLCSHWHLPWGYASPKLTPTSDCAQGGYCSDIIAWAGTSPQQSHGTLLRVPIDGLPWMSSELLQSKAHPANSSFWSPPRHQISITVWKLSCLLSPSLLNLSSQSIHWAYNSICSLEDLNWNTPKELWCQHLRASFCFSI